MGIAAALLLFVSVLLHELSHSLVARWRHIKVESITLFFFGGVAGITKEDMDPLSEFLMSIAGPLFSIVLAGVFFLVHRADGNAIVTAISFYLYQLNFVLGLFNLLPGYPLDGGRAFRALLYAHYHDLKKATKIAAMGGKVVGGALVLLGLLSMFNGAGNGLWFVLLGGFLFFIAGAGYEQVLVKEVLSKISVRELLRRKSASVNPELPFRDFVKEHAKSEQDAFVVQGKNFQGILDMNRLQRVPVAMGDLLRISQLAMPLESVPKLAITDDAYTAFRKMMEKGIDLLPVYDGKKLLGFVSKKTVLHRLMWDARYGHGERVGHPRK